MVRASDRRADDADGLAGGAVAHRAAHGPRRPRDVTCAIIILAFLGAEENYLGGRVLIGRRRWPHQQGHTPLN